MSNMWGGLRPRLSQFTKADLDWLVEEMRNGNIDLEPAVFFDGAAHYAVPTRHVRTSLYLAAGLTAEGRPKREKVRCYMYRIRGNGDPTGIAIGRMKEPPSPQWEHIPGTFVPDGAE